MVPVSEDISHLKSAGESESRFLSESELTRHNGRRRKDEEKDERTDGHKPLCFIKSRKWVMTDGQTDGRTDGRTEPRERGSEGARQARALRSYVRLVRTLAGLRRPPGRQPAWKVDCEGPRAGELTRSAHACVSHYVFRPTQLPGGGIYLDKPYSVKPAFAIQRYAIQYSAKPYSVKPT